MISENEMNLAEELADYVLVKTNEKEIDSNRVIAYALALLEADYMIDGESVFKNFKKARNDV